MRFVIHPRNLSVYTLSDDFNFEGEDWVRVHSPAGLDRFTTTQLITIYNRGLQPGSRPVRKFENHAVAARRTWAVLPAVAAQDEARRAAQRARAKTLVVRPQRRGVAPRPGTNQAIVVSMVSRPEGATVREMQEALQAAGRSLTLHSIQSMLYGNIKTLYNIHVRNENGRYHLRSAGSNSGGGSSAGVEPMGQARGPERASAGSRVQ